MTSLLGQLLDGLVGLAAPPSCAGCGAPDVVLCPTCAAPLAGPGMRVAPSGGGLAVPGRAHAPPVAAATLYEGVVPVLVNAWKERGRHDLEPVLGAALGHAVRELLDWLPPARARAPLVLVPVPSSRAARRRRGADGVTLLAGHAARALAADGVRAVVLPALRLTRRVADQSGLTASQRAANVAGAFVLDRRTAGRPALASGVVVVDDVLTTGSTLRAAAGGLAAGGAVVDGYACVAATPLRPTRSALSAPGRQD